MSAAGLIPPVAGQLAPQAAPQTAPQAEEDAGNGHLKGPTSFALQSIHSVHNESSKRHEEYVLAQQAHKPKKPARATSATATKKGEPKSVRHQASQIIQSITPPARVDSFLRAATQTPLSQKYTELSGTVRKLRLLLSKKYTAEEIAAGATPPTPEQRVAGEEQIRRCQQIIKDEGLGKHVIRIADNAAPALAIFLDWLIISLIDLAASNTHAMDRKMTEAKYSFDPASQPTEKQGGIDFRNSNCAPFLAELPTILNYNQVKEDELRQFEAARKKSERDEKKDQTAKRAQLLAQATESIVKQMKATIVNLQQVVNSGQPLTAPNGQVVTPELAQQQIAHIEKQIADGEAGKAAEAQLKANEEAKATTPRKPPAERNFLTYVEQLCRAAQDLHPAYQQMRVANRFKQQIDHLVQEFIERFGASVRSSITSNTLNGQNVMRMLEARQRFAGRPEAEIEGLRNTINDAIEKWGLHSESERLRKEAALNQKLAALSPEERAVIEQKRLDDERERLEASLNAQRARAEKAQQVAFEKEQKLRALAAGGGAGQPPAGNGHQAYAMPGFSGIPGM